MSGRQLSGTRATRIARTGGAGRAAAAAVALAVGLSAAAAAPAVGSAAPASAAPGSSVVLVQAPAASSALASTAITTTLRRGHSGAQVRAAQQQLSALGYWLGAPDGRYGLLTEQAVMALQGAAGLHRDGVLGPMTRRALAAGTVPAAASRRGRVVEVDRGRGLLLFVVDGRVHRVLHTSTGTDRPYVHNGRRLVADTPPGTFRVTWAHDGWRNGDLGRLYRPRYFHPDGIAVHGYTVVPAYPASHGCARVTTAAMDMIWRENLMPAGRTVLVR